MIQNIFISKLHRRWFWHKFVNDNLLFTRSDFSDMTCQAKPVNSARGINTSHENSNACRSASTNFSMVHIIVMYHVNHVTGDCYSSTSKTKQTIFFFFIDMFNKIAWGNYEYSLGWALVPQFLCQVFPRKNPFVIRLTGKISALHTKKHQMPHNHFWQTFTHEICIPEKNSLLGFSTMSSASICCYIATSHSQRHWGYGKEVRIKHALINEVSPKKGILLGIFYCRKHGCFPWPFCSSSRTMRTFLLMGGKSFLGRFSADVLQPKCPLAFCARISFLKGNASDQQNWRIQSERSNIK